LDPFDFGTEAWVSKIGIEYAQFDLMAALSVGDKPLKHKELGLEEK